MPKPQLTPLYDKLHEKLASLYERNEMEIHEKVVGFHGILISKYPDACQCLLFHLLSGSTPGETYGIFDFPGPDSIEHFINAEYARAFS